MIGNIIGATYSSAHYEEYEKYKNKELFEEAIIEKILEIFPPEIRARISALPKGSKRMAILSVLDNDRNLFLRIKAFTDKNIRKYDHIRDIVLMLREYVKVGEVEKKKYGEVMTPLELVKDMLNTLPDEVWTNPNLKWLDPANGTGPYPIMVILKLMNGLKGCAGLEDDEVRYKHIVENMIYVCELQPKNMFLYMCALDPWDNYDMNLYVGSFLEEGFDKHMKEVWNIDKFDIVMGNPPYQKENNSTITTTTSNVKLWKIFIEKSLKLIENDGFLNFVTPSSWASGTKNPHNSTNLFNDIFSKKNTIFVSFDVNKYFSGIGVDFSYYLIQNSIYKGVTKFRCGSTITEVNLCNFNLLPKTVNNKIFSILNKISIVNKFNFKMDRKDHYKKSLNDIFTNKFNIPVYCGPSKGILYSDKSSPYLKLPKIFTHRISSLKMIDDQNAEVSTNYSQVYVLEDGEVGKYACELFQTRFYIFLYKLFQYTQYNESITLNQLPKLDLSKSWSDEEIFKYFNLTEEEIDLILSN